VVGVSLAGKHNGCSPVVMNVAVVDGMVQVRLQSLPTGVQGEPEGGQ